MNEEENKSVEAVENAVEQGKKAARAEKENLDDGVIRVDLRNFKQEQEDAVQEQESESSVLEPVEQSNESGEETNVELQEVAEGNEEPVAQEETVLEEITEKEVQEQTAELADEIEEAIAEQKESGIELPENIQKVVDFINDTGGTLEDYVRLNQDYSQLNEAQLLREYYESTKPIYSRQNYSYA